MIMSFDESVNIKAKGIIASSSDVKK